MLHNAFLVHDDIEDGDEYRYGRRTIHEEHGLGAAINDRLRRAAGLAGPALWPRP